MISFVYRHEGTSSSNGTLSVGYITDPSDESTFVSLQDMEKVSTLTSVYVFLNTIPAEVTSANIAFKYSGGTSDNYNISIDDVIVQPITSCLTPQNLSVTEMDPHSVSLEWDDTYASAYQVAYAPSATFNLDSGLYQTVNLSTNSATISGLLPGLMRKSCLMRYPDGLPPIIPPISPSSSHLRNTPEERILTMWWSNQPSVPYRLI